MTGFGNKKKPIKKQKSKKLNSLAPNQLKERAVKEHIEGNLLIAEKWYEAFISTGINDPEVISNYA